jgi:hypothetical protein
VLVFVSPLLVSIFIGLRTTNTPSPELAFQQSERYCTPFALNCLRSTNDDPTLLIHVALSDLFQARNRAHALVYVIRKCYDKPHLVHASEYINTSEGKDKGILSKS